MKDKLLIRARDGTQLAVGRYLPESSNHISVVIAPALRCRQKQYSRLASFLCKNGYTVFTFDYRGVGRSRINNNGNHQDVSLYQWASTDLDTVILYARNQFPAHELAGIFHGVSGEIAGMAPASSFFNRMALVNAALSSWALANRRGRFRLLRGYLVSVLCSWLPLASPALSPGIPSGVLREWLSWSKYPNGLFHSYPINNYQKLRAQVLSLYFPEMAMASPRAARALLKHFVNASCSEWQLPSLGPGYRFYDKRLKKVAWSGLALWMKGEKAFGHTGGGNLQKRENQQNDTRAN